MIGSIAGSPLAQAKGSDIDKNKTDTGNQQRQVEANLKAEAAAGIGTTQEDAETSDRDADGRRLWELDHAGQKSTADESSEDPSAPPQAKDPSGQCGQSLDLSG
jgi:hypothetical protein